MPFLDAYWREIFMSRSIDRLELDELSRNRRCPIGTRMASGSIAMRIRW